MDRKPSPNKLWLLMGMRVGMLGQLVGLLGVSTGPHPEGLCLECAQSNGVFDISICKKACVIPEKTPEESRGPVDPFVQLPFCVAWLQVVQNHLRLLHQ